jgi:hypothetical protein
MKFRRSVIPAFVTLLVMFGVGFATIPIVISQLEIYLRKEEVRLRRDLRQVAIPLGPWSKAVDRDGNEIPDSSFGIEMIESLGTDKYLDRQYESDGEKIAVHVAYYSGMIDDVPHVPERCWDAQGLTQSMLPRRFELQIEYPGATTDGSPVNLATGRPYPTIERLNAIGISEKVHLPISGRDGQVAITVTEFLPVPGDPSIRRVGGYFFIANGRIAAGAGDVRMMAFDPREKYAYYCKVQLSYQGRLVTGEADDAVVMRFLDVAKDVLPRLIPEVMKCLPDWPEVETRTLKERSA